MKMKEMQNILENIITLFNENEGRLTTKELYVLMQTHFNFTKTLRSLELTYYPKLENRLIDDVIFIRNHREKHQLIDNRISNYEDKKKAHQKMLSKEQLIGEEKAYMRLALQAIKELPKLSDKHCETIEHRFGLRDLNTPYFIESEKTEVLQPNNFNTSELIYAIKNDYLVSFEYSGKSSQDIYIVEPYKLITFDGLWYLFGKDTEEDNNPYKTWRLKYISLLDTDRETKHDTPDHKIEDVLHKAHSADFIVEDIAKAEVESIHVKVKVHAAIADRVQLPGIKKVEFDNSDGSCTMVCDVSSIKEIDNDIKAWLPYIKVLEPLEYKEAFKKTLKSYVEDLD